MSLHLLAPELLAMVLERVTSPKDLYALISASSRCLRAFNLSPERTISAVLVNATSPEAYYDALAVAHAPSGPFRVDDSDSRERLESYTQRYFDGTLPSDLPLDRASLVSLCKTRRQIEYFIEDYAARAARTAVSISGDSSIAESWAPMSDSEKARFERAFFRYELYYRLQPYDVFSAEEQYDRFVSHLLAWETEELMSVHHHLCRAVDVYFRELNDQFFDAVVSAPGVQLDFKPLAEPSEEVQHADNTPKTAVKAAGRAFHNLDYETAGLNLFDRDRNDDEYNEWTSFVASHGLDLMYRLAVANREARKALIRQYSPYGRDFLSEAIYYASAPPPEPLPLRMRVPANTDCPDHDGDATDDSANVGDNWRTGTLGFRLLNRGGSDGYRGGREPYNDPDGPLREMAAVFWDAERFALPRVLAAFRKAEAMSSGQVEELYGPERGQSAQKRLEGVTLPSSEFKRITDEFHCFVSRPELGKGS